MYAQLIEIKIYMLFIETKEFLEWEKLIMIMVSTFENLLCVR